ncbi:hypothetical protein [Actinopolyspora halophila]|uniref:hypothetical protein n=1 Tax=Actinopolyspora halophila TaxID=1850 RepID=UPI00036282F0|nr:hypothetical protein [Actinopolyspora halophila]
MTADLPTQRSDESVRSYYRRLSVLRDALRAYLPDLRESAVQAGRDAGMKVSQIADRMGVSTAWLYTPRGAEVTYDASLIPEQEQREDALDYYARLAGLRDEISEKLPKLVVTAAREAEQETPAPTRTQLAADLGVTEGYLFKQLRRENHAKP